VAGESSVRNNPVEPPVGTLLRRCQELGSRDQIEVEQLRPTELS
jgi:hypothetical protein